MLTVWTRPKSPNKLPHLLKRYYLINLCVVSFGGYDIYFDDICAGNYYASTLEHIHNKVHQFLYQPTQHPNILFVIHIISYHEKHFFCGLYRHNFFSTEATSFFPPHCVYVSMPTLWYTYRRSTSGSYVHGPQTHEYLITWRSLWLSC